MDLTVSAGYPASRIPGPDSLYRNTDSRTIEPGPSLRDLTVSTRTLTAGSDQSLREPCIALAPGPDT